jgi:hypothetical protein
MEYIEYINVEHTLYLSKHLLRADIYLIICVDNHFFELLIETDENQHTSTNLNYEKQHKYDYYKDKYAIRNGVSLVRIFIENSNINDKNIDLALFCISYIIETKKPLYYFNKQYINFRKNINNNKYYEYSDIEDIL